MPSSPLWRNKSVSYKDKVRRRPQLKRASSSAGDAPNVGDPSRFMAVGDDGSGQRSAGAASITHHMAVPFPNWRDGVSDETIKRLRLSKAQIKQQELMYEIIETEETYLEDLKLVYQVFIKPCRAAEIMLPKKIRMLFSNVNSIIMFHQPLLLSLRERQDSQRPLLSGIADIYLSELDGFTLYMTYLINFEQAVALLDAALTDPKDALGDFLRRQVASPQCRRLTLQAFLLKPVQRLAKYPLIFKNLKECYPTTSREACENGQLVEQMDAIIRSIQDAQLEEQAFCDLESLANRIKGLQKYPDFTLARRGRKLRLEGEVFLSSTSRQPKPPPKSPSSSSSSLNQSPRTPTSQCLSPLPTEYFTEKIKPSAIKTAISQEVADNKPINGNVHLFLFDDILLITKRSSESMPGIQQPIYKLLSPPCRVTFVQRELPSKEGAKEQPISPINFTIVHSNNQTLSLIPQTLESRQAWHNALVAAIAGHTNRQKDKNMAQCQIPQCSVLNSIQEFRMSLDDLIPTPMQFKVEKKAARIAAAREAMWHASRRMEPLDGLKVGE
ncbi:hypothetical protein BZG36_00337 [Bifiguratus adelaidae]|uniref:DH domain-containing protein n=1 Tax=Bifiguratus adelaidae TaxID=1938954 RepID=A0A261Y880_9FUNG|nr:hypothetical protein BZG36_00337 [Bifiguratus adelaidae]